MKNIYGVTFTSKDIETLNKLTLRTEEMRAKAYERAVELYTQSEGDKTSVLSKKISVAERQNLVIIRPHAINIDLDEIKSQDEFKARIKVAEYELKYGAQEYAEKYAENYIQAVKNTYGAAAANQISTAVRDNPQGLVDAINARTIAPIKFIYKKGSDGETDEFVDSVKQATKK